LEKLVSEAGLSLRDGLDLAGLSVAELWLTYVTIGGNSTESEMARNIVSDDCGDYEHNLIAHAINESFLDRDEDHPVGYRHTE
jgi:hypothetical protein